MVYFDFHCRNCFAYNRVFLLCCGCSEWTECCKTEQLLKYQNIIYLFIYFFRVIRAFYVLFGLLYICITQCSWLPAPFTLLLRRGGSRLSRRTVLTQEEKKKKTTTSSVVSKHLWVVVMQRGIRVASTRTVGNKVTASCQDTTDHNGKRVCWRWVCSQSCLLLFFSIIIITRVFFFKGRYLRRRRARSRGVLSTNVRGMPGQGTGGVSGLPTGALAHGHIAFFLMMHLCFCLHFICEAFFLVFRRREGIHDEATVSVRCCPVFLTPPRVCTSPPAVTRCYSRLLLLSFVGWRFSD